MHTMTDLAHDLQNARPLDLARERIEDIAGKATAWETAQLADEDITRRAVDYFNQVLVERQRLEEERKAEKAPVIKQGKAIDRAYAEIEALLDKPWKIILAKVETLLKERKAAGEERPQLRGNYSRRAIALKSIWRAEVTDQLQLYCYFADTPTITELLTKLANAEAPAAHREGRTIPGTRLVEKEIAT